MPVIYTLSHPITEEVKYVGKTLSTLETRLKGHLTNKAKCAVRLWVLELQKLNLKPKIEELETIDSNISADTEMFWIEQFRGFGFRLLNIYGVKPTKPKERPLQKVKKEKFNRKLYLKLRRKTDLRKRRSGVFVCGKCVICESVFIRLVHTKAKPINVCSRECRRKLPKKILSNEAKNRISDAKKKPIVAFRGEELREYPSIYVACKDLGCAQSTISNVLAERSKRAKGWKFKYKVC